MWFIRRKHDGKKVYLIAKEYTIGRKACTLDITDDATVSRKHCKFMIEKYENDQPPSFKAMDLKSTFGVYIIAPNSASTTKINPNEWVEVTKNSTIVFGTQNHWVVGWQDVPVLVSGNVQPERRKQLQILLQTLGSQACQNWHQDVMCLVMDKIAFTHKVLEVLLAAKPITTLEFFEKWLQLLENNPESSPPNPSDYLPPLDSSLTAMFKEQDFLPNPLRKELFAGKAFLFPAQPNATAVTAIKNAGGLVVLEDHPNRAQLVIIDRDNHPTSSPSDFYLYQEKLALSRGERLVPEREISLAILSASCQRYCNPMYNFSGKLDPTNGRKKERQDPDPIGNGEPPSKKKKFENVEVVEPPVKKARRTTETSTAQKTFKNPPATLSDSVAATQQTNTQENSVIANRERSRNNPTSRSFVNANGCERSSHNATVERSSWLRSQNSHLEKTQVIRSQAFRSSLSTISHKDFGKIIPKRLTNMKTVVFKEGKWL